MKKTNDFIIYVIDYFEKFNVDDNQEGHMKLQKGDDLLTMVATELINEKIDDLIKEFNEKNPKRTISLAEVREEKTFSLLVAEIENIIQAPEETDETQESYAEEMKRISNTLSRDPLKIRELAKRFEPQQN